jgi:hypothetical protein
MKPWVKRPVEEANLLNPAFCCVTVTTFASGYAGVDPSGVPFPLAFLALPLSLHKATRDKLPPNTRTSLAAWLQDNVETRLGFASRVMALRPYTREAVMYGLLHGWLKLADGGRLIPLMSEPVVDRNIRKIDEEARDCVRRAKFIGRWLAAAGPPQTVMALWGIRP